MSESGDMAMRSDGHLIKVLEVLDGCQAFLGRTTNGNSARFSLGQRADIRRGSVVFVGDDGWEVVPNTAWPEIPEVAIIRRILEDGLLIEYGAGIRYVPGKPLIEVAVGNTVQFSSAQLQPRRGTNLQVNAAAPESSQSRGPSQVLVGRNPDRSPTPEQDLAARQHTREFGGLPAWPTGALTAPSTGTPNDTVDDDERGDSPQLIDVEVVAIYW